MRATLAVSLAAVGILLLVASTWWQPAPTAAWQHAADELIDTLWPLLLVASAAVVIYRRVLLPRITRQFERVSNQAYVTASPPRETMAALLSRVYGDTHSTHDVVVGVLGGAGLEPYGGDLTISTFTTVDLELRRVDRQSYELKAKLVYTFKENVTGHRFAIFATCDPKLRDLITLACRLPLYEEWFIPNPAIFEESVDRIASSAHIGIRYSDLDDQRHRVEPTKVELVEVSYRRWSDFLTIFREPVGMVPKQDTHRYMRTLRIFEFDLGELADDEHAVSSIHSLSITSSSMQSLDDPFCYWTAPYPCYLERLSFDAAGLGWHDDESFLFRVVPFSFRTAIASGQWVPAEELKDVLVRSWLLPGHGVALMWKPKAPNAKA